MKTKSLLVLLFAILLAFSFGGCGWQFAAFQYESTIEAEPAVASVNNPEEVTEPVVGADGETIDPTYVLPAATSMTSLALTGNPVADVFVQMMQNSGAIDAAKTISVCIVGDPAAIGAFRIDNRLFKKITVKKGIMVIKTKDSK